MNFATAYPDCFRSRILCDDPRRVSPSSITAIRRAWKSARPSSRNARCALRRDSRPSRVRGRRARRRSIAGRRISALAAVPRLWFGGISDQRSCSSRSARCGMAAANSSSWVMNTTPWPSAREPADRCGEGRARGAVLPDGRLVQHDPGQRAGERPEPAQALARDQRQLIEVLVERRDAEAAGERGASRVVGKSDLGIARKRAAAPRQVFGQRRAAPLMIRVLRREREDAVAGAPRRIGRAVER